MVTLFVLVLSMRGKDDDRHRVLAAPVRSWSCGRICQWAIIYSITDHLLIPDPRSRTHLVLGPGYGSIGEGTGRYQLYFLLISMRIYLLFPLIHQDHSNATRTIPGG